MFRERSGALHQKHAPTRSSRRIVSQTVGALASSCGNAPRRSWARGQHGHIELCAQHSVVKTTAHAANTSRQRRHGACGKQAANGTANSRQQCSPSKREPYRHQRVDWYRGRSLAENRVPRQGQEKEGTCPSRYHVLLVHAHLWSSDSAFVEASIGVGPQGHRAAAG